MQSVSPEIEREDTSAGPIFSRHPRFSALLDRGAVLCSGMFILNLVWNGFSTISALVPGEFQRRAALAASPWSTGTPQAYQQESPFFYLLAHAVRAIAPSGYLALCIAVLLAAYFSFFLFARRNMDKRLATLSFLLLLAHPVSYISQTWLGMADCVTILCTVIVLFSTNWLALLVASAIAMFNHPVALFIVLSVLFLRMLSEPGALKWRAAASGIIGLILGLSFAVLRIAGISPESRWGFITATPMRLWLVINARYLPLALYSFGFAFWILAVFMLRYYRSGNPPLYRSYIVCMVIFYGVTFFCRDTTRVFALLSWAPTLLVIMHAVRASMREDTYRARLFQASVEALRSSVSSLRIYSSGTADSTRLDF